ncbi:hypothetical protein [Nitrosophilus alvini]|uniref:hypothetical protein n=1 Tax=Nitrosophilus alvini TaxID=2714855 RepID=UPI00190A4D0A|nr:hypothetical protein [Nitrosophilus alvini]
MEYFMQDIPPGDFLPIFVSSAFVIIFGMAYAGFFTFVKIKVLPKYYIYVAYLSWFMLAACMYYLGTLLRVEPYTEKVLMGAMVGYLIFPHAVFFILQRLHEEFEPDSKN